MTTTTEPITPFNEIPISTTTIIVNTNLEIDLQELFVLLPVADLNIPPELKNKNKIKQYILDSQLPLGSIISIQFQDQIRGIRMSKKSTFFRNNMSIYIIIKDKVMNFKVPIRGKMQITGATQQEQANSCVKYFISHLLNTSKKVYTIVNGQSNIKLVFKTVMTDIVFNVGFEVNRQKLNDYINHMKAVKYSAPQVPYKSTLNTSVGYTGVNIKRPFTHEDTSLFTMELIDEEKEEWKVGTTTFGEYLNMLSPPDRKKEVSKERHNTFLVFYSGTTIMSGMTPYYMKKVYYDFNEMIRKARPMIEEVDVL